MTKSHFIKPAKFISLILSPTILSIVTFIIVISNSGVTFINGIAWLLLISFLTILLPMLYIHNMKRNGTTVSMDLPEKEIRFRPLFLTGFLYMLTSMVLLFLKAPMALTAVCLFYGINTAFSSVVSPYWKISIHGMAGGGAAAVLGQLVSPAFYGGWFLLPLLYFARTTIKAHTPLQVITGFCSAFLLTIIEFKIWEFIC